MLIYSTSCFRYVSCSIGTYLSVPVLTYMYICDLEQTLDTLPQLTPPIKAPRRQLVASWCHTPPTVPNGRPTVAQRSRRAPRQAAAWREARWCGCGRARPGARGCRRAAPPACRACEVRDGAGREGLHREMRCSSSIENDSSRKQGLLQPRCCSLGNEQRFPFILTFSAYNRTRNKDFCLAKKVTR